MGRRGGHLSGRLGCCVDAVRDKRKRNGGLNFVTRRVKHRVGALNSGDGRTRVRGLIIRVGSRLRRVGRRMLGMLWGQCVTNGLVVFSTPSNSNGSAVVGFLLGRGLGLRFSVSTADQTPHNARGSKIRCCFLAPSRFHTHVTTKSFLRCRRICASGCCNALGDRIRQELVDNSGIVFSISIMKNYGVGGFCNSHTLSIFVRPPSVRSLQDHLRKHNASTPRMVRDHVTGTRFRLNFTSGFSMVIIGSGLRITRGRTLGIVGRFLGGT